MEDVTELSIENDGENDDGPYCICQQNSYGEVCHVIPYLSPTPTDRAFTQMIGCDNGTDCPYQWVCGSVHSLEAILMMLQFHLPCVNVAKPLPNTWYCDDCSKKLGLDNNGTSGNGATGSERGRKRRTR